jgi:DNA-binding transcriptional MerR regulator
VTGEGRYGVDELADLGGVSRRTVRYYVQEGLLPEPLGVGRGRHYGPAHLASLLRVKHLQEQGLSLDAIRERLAGRTEEPAPAPPLAARSSWTRITLVPGVELHVAGGLRLPSPGRLLELVEWCRRHFPADRGDS